MSSENAHPETETKMELALRSLASIVLFFIMHQSVCQIKITVTLPQLAEPLPGRSTLGVGGI